MYIAINNTSILIMLKSQKHPKYLIAKHTFVNKMAKMCWSKLGKGGLLRLLKLIKKRLKIPKGQSKSVNRRTDNTMAKTKRTKGLIDWLVLNANFSNILAILWTKGQTTIYQILHSKLKIVQHGKKISTLCIW